MVKAEIEMLKKSLFSLKLFWEQDDEYFTLWQKWIFGSNDSEMWLFAVKIAEIQSAIRVKI